MERVEVQQKNLDKKFKIAYIILGALLALVLVVSVVQYVHYKMGQSKAVEIIKNEAEIMDEIDCDKDDSDTAIANAAYSFLNTEPEYYHDYSQDEIDPDYNPYRSLDVDLGEKLEKEGYKSPFGSDISYFLEYTSFGGYVSDQYLFDVIKMPFVFLILIILAAVAVGLNVLYKTNVKKNKYVIDNEFLIHIDNNIEKEKYLIPSIKSLELTKFDGMKIIGDGFLLKIMFIENRDKIKDILYNIMYPQQQ